MLVWFEKSIIFKYSKPIIQPLAVQQESSTIIFKYFQMKLHTVSDITHQKSKSINKFTLSQIYVFIYSYISYGYYNDSSIHTLRMNIYIQYRGAIFRPFYYPPKTQ